MLEIILPEELPEKTFTVQEIYTNDDILVVAGIRRAVVIRSDKSGNLTPVAAAQLLDFLTPRELYDAGIMDTQELDIINDVLGGKLVQLRRSHCDEVDSEETADE